MFRAKKKKKEPSRKKKSRGAKLNSHRREKKKKLSNQSKVTCVREFLFCSVRWSHLAGRMLLKWILKKSTHITRNFCLLHWEKKTRPQKKFPFRKKKKETESPVMKSEIFWIISKATREREKKKAKPKSVFPVSPHAAFFLWKKQVILFFFRFFEHRSEVTVHQFTLLLKKKKKIRIEKKMGEGDNLFFVSLPF